MREVGEVEVERAGGAEVGGGAGGRASPSSSDRSRGRRPRGGGSMGVGIGECQVRLCGCREHLTTLGLRLRIWGWAVEGLAAWAHLSVGLAGLVLTVLFFLTS